MTSEIHLTLIQPHVIGIPVLHTGSVLNIISINANGLRTQLKRDLLEKLLIDLQAGVGIIPETHLRKPDLAWIRYPNYTVVADYCRRVPIGRHIAGGVLILVHNSITTAKLPRNLRLAPTFELRHTKLYPTKDPITAICISAVYLPPRGAKKIKMDMLHKLSEAVVDKDTNAVLPHIFAGDFNTTGWQRLYEEWLQEQGIMDLMNPQVPTYAGGSAIDKFLFMPGEYIPSTLLPDSMGPRQEHDQSPD